MASTDSQDVIAMLREDHRKVEKLFTQFEEAKGESRKQKLAHEICLELSVHSAIEEEIFYPACAGKVDEELLQESYVEHDAAKLLIAEIENGQGGSDEFFDSKMKVLREQIEHHVEEEEKPRSGLFAQARAADLDLKGLGEKLAARKEELTTNYKAAGIPKAELATMDEVEA